MSGCRYWHGGEPLWARPVSESPGPCSHCGAPKRFEMQLMPPLVYFLQESKCAGVGEWEWVTVAVFTCSEVGGHNEAPGYLSKCRPRFVNICVDVCIYIMYMYMCRCVYV